MSAFPQEIFTEKEHASAKKLINQGYKHNLTVEGSQQFKEKVVQALELTKLTGDYDFIRTYIRKIKEIDGITQLREAEVEIWTTISMVENIADGASLFIEKAYYMKAFIDGEIYYDIKTEEYSTEKRIEFLRNLQAKSKDEKIKEECQRFLDMWTGNARYH
jgi:hypothetical protein